MEKLFTNSPKPEINPWKLSGEEVTLAKKFGLVLVSQGFINPITEETEEYVSCRKAPGVTVIPMFANGDLVITRTFKQGSNDIFWEFPAGRKSKGVTSEDQAIVELAEESGLITDEMIYLGRACVAPRKFGTYEDLYIALDCKFSTPRPEKGEILEVFRMTPKEMWEIVRLSDGMFSGFSEIALRRAADMGLIK